MTYRIIPAAIEAGSSFTRSNAESREIGLFSEAVAWCASHGAAVLMVEEESVPRSNKGLSFEDAARIVA